MNIKSEVNQLQKQMLDRLNVRTGSTLYIIIQEISRQAYVKQSFVVSQKNSTLATKCNVTASTISRNLKKLKDKCNDLLTIEQNRNCEEKFAALVFTFIPQESDLLITNKEEEMSNGVSNGMSNGQEHKLVNTDNVCNEISQPTSNISTLTKNIKNIINVKQEGVEQQEQQIYDTYLAFKKQGINKTMFNKVLAEVQSKQGIKNFKAYLTGALNKVVHHISYRNGTKIYANEMNQAFYDFLNG